MSEKMLERINCPQDIKGLGYKELDALCAEMRSEMISVVSKNGGHLASNLGAAELTVALHRVLNCPHDRLIFDVSHQCYAHKLLTGRYSRFSTLRQLNGISGFTNRQESVYDTLTAGHSGPSLSAAVGIAQAKKLMGSEDYTVCVIGDGSFTNGMVYEALNNCEDKDLKLIIVLNDNEMSISKNVGSLSTYFRKIRSTKGYFSLKAGTKAFLSGIPLIGGGLLKVASGTKSLLKRIFVRANFFECLGLEYLGPVDGHDIRQMELALNEAKSKKRVTLLHVLTKKGKGYAPAELSPERFHGVGPFDISTGRTVKGKECFSTHFGKTMEKLAAQDEHVCAVTAAMCEGTGLSGFRRDFPDRFFDVGIAEEHALTFSSGLSLEGYKPVCVLYSTFSQRCFDQLMHDVSLQKLPMIIALDRAGIVPFDGATHQGVFDIPLFSMLPDVEIYSPERFFELDEILKRAVEEYRGIRIIRYPKGGDAPARSETALNTLCYFGDDDPELIAVTYGRLTARVEAAARLCKRRVRVIKLTRVYPPDICEISRVMGDLSDVIVFEEGARRGGVGELLAAKLPQKNVRIHAIDGYLPHGDLNGLYALAGFTPEKMAKQMEEII